MNKQSLLSECLGSFLLSATVVGSGIMASSLANGNGGIALLGNSLATGAILFVLVKTLGPVSGAHLNPAVTAAFLLERSLPIREGIGYIVAQITGCVLGVFFAHLMYDQTILQTSNTSRSGVGQFVSEIAATFTLVFAIVATLRIKPNAIAAVVALVITAGYWWTASTSSANPAISIARAFTDTFAGISPVDVPAFILAQFLGATLAVMVSRSLFSAAPHQS